MEDKKFDIIIIAGQSNAEGNGVREADAGETINDNVFHLIDKNSVSLHDNEKGETVLDIKMPVETLLEVAHERKVGDRFAADFSETFADEYIKGGNLQEGRSVLLVKAAVGGTGFAKKQWGVGKPLSDRLFQMVDRALSLNGENRIVALLWHQGEHDAFENVDLNEKERYDFYHKNLFEQLNAVRERYSAFDFPIIAGKFASSWKWGAQNKEKIEAIYTATSDVLNELGNSGYVSSEGLKSNDEAIGNGDDIHFCAESVRELGKRYYKTFESLRTGK